MFKRHVHIFGVCFFILFSFLPAYNILIHASKSDDVWYNKKILFNFDGLISGVATVLSVFRITPYGEKVLLGKEGWMFLGDEFYKTLTHAQRGVADQEIKKNAVYIYDALLAWDAYFKARGIPFFKVVIIPDKHTVYPEFLPDWFKLAPQSLYDYLLAHDKGRLFIDLKKYILLKKSKGRHFLYFKTDSHWNTWGGAIAARHITDVMAMQGMKNLKKLPAELFDPVGNMESQDGDLVRLARIKNKESEAALFSHYAMDNRLITQVNPLTNESHDVSIQETVAVDHDPIVVTSDRALNKKKLIWMRDSFGETIKVPLSLMFSDVLQWKQTERFNIQLFEKLVQEWQADGILYTVVERHLSSALMQSCPPVNTLALPKMLHFVSNARFLRSTELTEGEKSKTGISFDVLYQFKDPLTPCADHYLMIDLPQDAKQKGTLIFSWEGDTYEEEKGLELSHRKVVVELSAGKQLVHLGAVVGWRGYQNIKKLKLRVKIPIGSEIELPESLWIAKIPFTNL
ncbi:MAG: hypothetical protein H2057_01140 [Alphaproteobacteria bacterium]|nr:hypothetical protein [Alphaproteobacteria bacterium]